MFLHGLIFFQHFQDNVPGVGTQMFLILFCKLLRINGISVFYHYFA